MRLSPDQPSIDLCWVAPWQSTVDDVRLRQVRRPRKRIHPFLRAMRSTVRIAVDVTMCEDFAHRILFTPGGSAPNEQQLQRSTRVPPSGDQQWLRSADG